MTLVCPDYVKTKLSIRALTGSGKSFGQMDSQVSKGFDASYVVDCALRAVYLKESEVWVCSMGTKIGLYILLIFPFIMVWYTGKRLNEQLQTIKKKE